jgi:hypothetical protein
MHPSAKQCPSVILPHLQLHDCLLEQVMGLGKQGIPKQMRQFQAALSKADVQVWPPTRPQQLGASVKLYAPNRSCLGAYCLVKKQRSCMASQSGQAMSCLRAFLEKQLSCLPSPILCLPTCCSCFGQANQGFDSHACCLSSCVCYDFPSAPVCSTSAVTWLHAHLRDHALSSSFQCRAAPSDQRPLRIYDAKASIDAVLLGCR